jgi:hypothetical protein
MEIESLFYTILQDGKVRAIPYSDRTFRKLYVVRRTQAAFLSLSFTKIKNEIWIIPKESSLCEPAPTLTGK